MTSNISQVPDTVKLPAKLLRRPVPTHQPGSRYPTVEDVSRRQFLVGVGSLLVLSPYGCGPGSGGPSATVEGPSRTVGHVMGETEVPVDPQRVIALDPESADTLVALDLTPVGSAAFGTEVGIPDYVTAGADDQIQETGPYAQPNLETIATLEPDLILGSGSTVEFLDVYDQLAQIAPTVGWERNPGSSWQENLREVSAVVGRETEARRATEVLERRIEELRGSLGDLLDQTISYLRVLSEGYRLYTPESGIAGGALIQLGFEFAPISARAESHGQWVEFSEEALAELVTGERLFLSVGSSNDVAGGRAALEDLQDGPLWQSLPAVRAGSVCRVENLTAWTRTSALGVEVALDEIEACLL